MSILQHLDVVEMPAKFFGDLGVDREEGAGTKGLDELNPVGDMDVAAGVTFDEISAGIFEFGCGRLPIGAVEIAVPIGIEAANLRR